MKQDARNSHEDTRSDAKSKSVEAAILGSILLFPSGIELATAIVSPLDYQDPAYRAIFRAMVELHREGKPIDPELIKAQLKGVELGERAEVILIDVAKVVPHAQNLTEYCQILKRRAQERRQSEILEHWLAEQQRGVSSEDVALGLRADLDDLERADLSNRLKFKGLTCAELDATKFDIRYAMAGMLVHGQPCIIAGPKKALKTSLLVAMAISLATGLDLFDTIRVYQRCRVGVMSGESGMATLQETARRIAKSMLVELAEVEGLLWTSDLPKLGDSKSLEALRKFITENELEVLIIDPAYLCMDGADAGNLFKQGEQLRGLNQVCEETGATLVLVHHTRKNGKVDPYSPPELEDIAWAGFQEWARQWVLVGRREGYKPGSGEHALWLSTGGSAGHSSLWGLDVSEGTRETPGGRFWEAKLLKSSEVISDARSQREQRKQKEQQEQLELDRRAVVDAVHSMPEKKATYTGIHKKVGRSHKALEAVIKTLLEDGTLQKCKVVNPNNKQTYDGYTPTPDQTTLPDRCTDDPSSLQQPPM